MITPRELAAKHFTGGFRESGNEIKATYCPFCGGGQHREKYTFAVNARSGAYNCKRGTCSASAGGSFRQLCEHFGEDVQKKKYEISRPKKNYVEPNIETSPVSGEAARFLTSRGISQAAWERRGVRESRGALVFPYTEDGRTVLVKYRGYDPRTKAWKKIWAEPGGKPVFWGMDLADRRFPLVIVEGELDALALEECEIPNAVSIPNGAQDLQCIDTCWEWLQQFKHFIIWTDSDQPGTECMNNIVKRLGAWRCSVVVSERKDANEVLLLDGREAVVEAVRGAQEVPVVGIKRLAELGEYDPGSDVVVKSGIQPLDSVLGGGFRMGEVTVWTGVNSSGKSTLLGQVMLAAVEQRFPVCAYSGELPDRIFRYWIDLQAAGPAWVREEWREDRKASVYRPDPGCVKAIRSWYRDYFFLYDTKCVASEENLLEVFTYAVQRYGCRVFTVDNLMTTVTSGTERDYFRKQSEFIGRMVEFAHQYDVHVHIVAHPRKTQGSAPITKMDVAGSGDITNRADNVLALHRCTRKEKLEDGANRCEAKLKVFKNRFGGRQDIEIQLDFDFKSKRFFLPSDPQGPNWVYSWIYETEEARRQLEEWESLGTVVSSGLFS